MLINTITGFKEISIEVLNNRGIVIAVTHFNIKDNINPQEMQEIALENSREVLNDGMKGIDFSHSIARN